jgi:hypothetical protein
MLLRFSRALHLVQLMVRAFLPRPRRSNMVTLTPQRISYVVDAHKLSEVEGDAATKFALDMINIMVERHLTAPEVACALEILAHLRNDRVRVS